MAEPDPVLVELVKFLARYCAERDYEEHIRRKRETRLSQSGADKNCPAAGSPIQPNKKAAW